MHFRFALLTVFTATLFVPAWAQDGVFPAQTGLPYHGAVTVEAVSPQHGTTVHRDTGQAEITMVKDGLGRIQLEGHATLNGQEVLRFSYLLTQDAGNSWVEDIDKISMTVSPEGQIAAFDRSGPAIITAAGKVNADALTLHLRRKASIADEGELELIFTFDLSADQATPGPADGAGCRTVIWQPRMIANPFGATMSAVMVPVCVPGN